MAGRSAAVRTYGCWASSGLLKMVTRSPLIVWGRFLVRPYSLQGRIRPRELGLGVGWMCTASRGNSVHPRPPGNLHQLCFWCDAPCRRGRPSKVHPGPLDPRLWDACSEVWYPGAGYTRNAGIRGARVHRASSPGHTRTLVRPTIVEFQLGRWVCCWVGGHVGSMIAGGFQQPREADPRGSSEVTWGSVAGRFWP